MTTTAIRRRTATALTWSLLLVGGLASCDQDSAQPTAGDGSMMQRQSQTQFDLDRAGPSEGRQLRSQLETWCQDLLGDRSWPALDAGERAEVMRTMHRRMRSVWDDSSGPMMWSQLMPGSSMMTRGCHAVR